jgi:pimeloyl-ACP methyl ester carboxylesterase
LRNIVHFGMLMCVTGSEDIPRIESKEVPRLTRDTFLGDGRVRRQMAVADLWPRGNVSPSYGEPVKSKVPVLLLSGTHDPVTPPRFGAQAAKHLKNSLHLVVPGAHGVSGPVIARIIQEFLARGRVEGLETSGIDKIRLPPLKMP